MTSTPNATPATVAAVRPPRQPRGYIASYGVGRVCADPKCRTTLSRYNNTELCYPHADELASRLFRARP